MKSLFLLLTLLGPVSVAALTTSELRCEYYAAPLAIGTPKPRFSWKLTPTAPSVRDVHQVAYEIQAARAADGFEKKTRWLRMLNHPGPTTLLT